ncbi:MAG: hypothetical protein LBC27_07965 [Spirochaetaceae bacterium]|jgi:hypothetical protein|nr:hypothetical protein [Spirochaetaceae bacterium]
MKRLQFILALYFISLSQCDIWNKPIIEQITKAEEQPAVIESIAVKTYPWPNVFFVNCEKPALWSPDENDTAWETDGWEAAYGLEIMGFLNDGNIIVLTPDMYTIEDFDNIDADEKKEIKVTLNDENNERDKAVTTEFYIKIAETAPGGIAYYEIKGYEGEGGSAVPYPSMGESGKTTPVQVHVSVKSGYILKSNGLSYSVLSPPPPPYPMRKSLGTSILKSPLVTLII